MNVGYFLSNFKNLSSNNSSSRSSSSIFLEKKREKKLNFDYAQHATPSVYTTSVVPVSFSFDIKPLPFNDNHVNPGIYFVYNLLLRPSSQAVGLPRPRCLAAWSTWSLEKDAMKK